MAHNAQFDLAALCTLESFHHIIGIHLDERLAVGTHDAVARQQAYLLGRSTVDDGHHIDRILLHHEAHAYTAERTTEVIIGLLGILHAQIAAVRIKFLEDAWHGILHQLRHVDGIHIVVVDNLQQVAQLVGTCVDDAQSVAREMTRAECTDKDAHYHAQRYEQRSDASLDVVVHIHLLVISYIIVLRHSLCPIPIGRSSNRRSFFRPQLIIQNSQF